MKFSASSVIADKSKNAWELLLIYTTQIDFAGRWLAGDEATFLAGNGREFAIWQIGGWP